MMSVKLKFFILSLALQYLIVGVITQDPSTSQDTGLNNASSPPAVAKFFLDAAVVVATQKVQNSTEIMTLKSPTSSTSQFSQEEALGHKQFFNWRPVVKTKREDQGAYFAPQDPMNFAVTGASFSVQDDNSPLPERIFRFDHNPPGSPGFKGPFPLAPSQRTSRDSYSTSPFIQRQPIPFEFEGPDRVQIFNDNNGQTFVPSSSTFSPMSSNNNNNNNNSPFGNSFGGFNGNSGYGSGITSTGSPFDYNQYNHDRNTRFAAGGNNQFNPFSQTEPPEDIAAAIGQPIKSKEPPPYNEKPARNLYEWYAQLEYAPFYGDPPLPPPQVFSELNGGRYNAHRDQRDERDRHPKYDNRDYDRDRDYYERDRSYSRGGRYDRDLEDDDDRDKSREMRSRRSSDEDQRRDASDTSLFKDNYRTPPDGYKVIYYTGDGQPPKPWQVRSSTEKLARNSYDPNDESRPRFHTFIPHDSKFDHVPPPPLHGNVDNVKFSKPDFEADDNFNSRSSSFTPSSSQQSNPSGFIRGIATEVNSKDIFDELKNSKREAAPDDSYKLPPYIENMRDKQLVTPPPERIRSSRETKKNVMMRKKKE